MRRVVADASAIVEYLLGTPRGTLLRVTFRDESVDIHVPAICDVEVAAGLRRALLARWMSRDRGHEAVEDYRDLPITRHGHTTLLPRMLELRERFSAYDAAYVALAERLDAQVLTADARLGRAIRAHTDLEVAR